MNRKISALCGAALLAASFPAIAQQPTVPAKSPLETALASPDRTRAEIAQDESRKPAEVLSFFGLKAGDQAAEFLAGGGYYATLMASVVGKDGSVVALNPPAFMQRQPSLERWSDAMEDQPNISLKLGNFADFKAKENAFDFAMMHLVYHDVYFESERFGITRAEPDVFLTELFKGMKPGGVVAVIDHVGEGKDTRALVEKTHRIDPAVVKADFARAGFTLAAESNMLANDTDDASKNVFHPAVRGKTNRFMYKFVKPAS